MTNLVDIFINKSFKKEKVLLLRARTLVIIIFSLLVALCIYTGFYLQKEVYWGIKGIFNYIGITCTIYALITIKRSSNLKTPLRIVSLVGIVLITVSAYLSGGIYSYDLSWYIVATATAFMFIGKQEGIFHVLVSILCISAFYINEVYDFILITPMEVSTTSHYKYANTIIMFIIFNIIVVTLLRSNQKLIKIINEKKEHELRDEISRDFHDQIGNQLASIGHLSRISLELSTLPEQKKLLQTIENRSLVVYQNFKDFIWSQKSNNLNSKELFLYLKDFVEEYFKLTDIKIITNYRSSIGTSNKLSTAQIKELIPIIKEAVTNVLKHSKCTEFTFLLEEYKDRLIFCINDNGVGLNKENSQGNGLKNMIVRGNRINSVLSFDNKKGTHITIVLPIILVDE